MSNTISPARIILDNPIRTRYRHRRDPDDVMLMTPGEPEELHIDLWNTAFTPSAMMLPVLSAAP